MHNGATIAASHYHVFRSTPGRTSSWPCQIDEVAARHRRNIRRLRRGGGFVYSSAANRKITKRTTLDRIESLRIPPAWKDVWICPKLDVCDRRLAPIVRRCRALPGAKVFQFIDSKGDVRDLGSQDVNAYVREIMGDNFTAKDFRTWAGTVLTVQSLRKQGDAVSATAAKRELVRAIDTVAEQLGNTRAVCRSSYIHPAVLESYLDHSLLRSCRKGSKCSTVRYWSADEESVLRWLKKLRRQTSRP